MNIYQRQVEVYVSHLSIVKVSKVNDFNISVQELKYNNSYKTTTKKNLTNYSFQTSILKTKFDKMSIVDCVELQTKNIMIFNRFSDNVSFLRLFSLRFNRKFHSLMQIYFQKQKRSYD